MLTIKFPDGKVFELSGYVWDPLIALVKAYGPPRERAHWWLTWRLKNGEEKNFYIPWRE